MSPDSAIRNDALWIWNSALDAINPSDLIEQQVKIDSRGIQMGDFFLTHSQYANVLVIGAGKAGAAMAAALEMVLDGNLPAGKSLYGQVNVPEGYQSTTRHIKLVPCRPPAVNLPNDRVVEATSRLLHLMQTANQDDLVVALISGGGSALLEKPVPTINLNTLIETTKRVADAGADIGQLNAIRSRLSQVKSGGLVRHCRNRYLVSLILSDVIGDSLTTIASGPTVLPDDPLASASLNVLNDLGIDPGLLSPAVIDALIQRPATLSVIPQIHPIILGNNQTAVTAACEAARKLGYRTELEIVGDVHSSAPPYVPRGETAEAAGRRLARILAKPWKPDSDQPVMDQVEMPHQQTLPAVNERWCFISGGEPTVKLPANSGRGGRNQHLILSAIDELMLGIAPSGEFCLLSGGTDGEDGSTTAAGALFDHLQFKHLCDRISAATEIDDNRQYEGFQTAVDESQDGGLSGYSLPSESITIRMADCLRRFDSGSLLEAWDYLLQTGATHTNVCDLRILLKRKSN